MCFFVSYIYLLFFIKYMCSKKKVYQMGAISAML